MERKGGWRGAALLLTIVVLALAFWYGGNAPGLHGWTVGASPSPMAVHPPSASAAVETSVPPAVAASAKPVSVEAPSLAAPTPTSTSTAPAPAVTTAPEEPLPSEETGQASCTVSIRCDAILEHLDALEEGKRELVPEDGVILAPTAVCFEPGESAFDALRRVCRDGQLHMEFTTTPIYGTAYIEGIQNLYEFDCGELSGWMYSVNGQYLDLGASAYSLRDGDVIEWQYTCQRGEDLPESPAGER